MVSKAKEDLPDPETPVTTVRVLWPIEKSMFFRLWTRAPRTTMLSVDIWKRDPCNPGGPRQNRHSVTRGLRRGYRISLLYGTGDMGQAESLFLDVKQSSHIQTSTMRASSAPRPTPAGKK